MNEVNKAYASVQDLSTPSDTSKWKEWTKLMLLSIDCLHRRPHLNLTIKHWMKWTKLMLLSNICLPRRPLLNERSEQSWCFSPCIVYTSTTSKFDDQTLNEVNKADSEKLVMIHIYLVVLCLRTLSSLVLNSYSVQQHVEVTRWWFIFRLPKTGKVSYNLA